MELTKKQEAFCHAVIECGSKSEAYRRAYDTSGMTPKSVNETASRLASSVKISARIQLLRDEIAEREIWKRIDSLKVLAEVAKGLDAEAKPSDKVNAVKALNSMHGWDKQVIEQTTTHSLDESLADRLTGGSKR